MNTSSDAAASTYSAPEPAPEPAPDWADETEARLLLAALPHAGRLGWTRRLMAAAARDIGLAAAEAELLAPEGGRDLAALLARRHDQAALAALAAQDPASLKIRERIRLAVLARVEAAAADGEATRRWMGFLALPANGLLGLRLAWASADVLWRWAGDVATDENHYTKRALLAEILVTTLAIRLASGPAAAETHLDGRIAGVMAFERWKAGLKHRTSPSGRPALLDACVTDGVRAAAESNPPRPRTFPISINAFPDVLPTRSP